MQFSFLTTLSATVALAAPIKKRCDNDELIYFNLASLRSGSELQYAPITYNEAHSHWLSVGEANATTPTFALNTTSGLLTIPDNEQRFRNIYYIPTTGDFGTSSEGDEGFSVKAVNDAVSLLEWKGDENFSACEVNGGDFTGVYSLEIYPPDYEGFPCAEPVGIQILVEPKTK